MSWDLAKERQNEALKRFFVMLFAMTGFSAFFNAGLVSPALHIRNAAWRLLWLAQALTGRHAAFTHDFPDWTGPPEATLREPHELLNAQNMAGRVAALNRELDDLHEQAGRLVRWRSARDREIGLFPCIFQINDTQQWGSFEPQMRPVAVDKNHLPLPRSSQPATNAPPPDT